MLENIKTSVLLMLSLFFHVRVSGAYLHTVKIDSDMSSLDFTLWSDIHLCDVFLAFLPFVFVLFRFELKARPPLSAFVLTVELTSTLLCPVCFSVVPSLPQCTIGSWLPQ